MGGVADERDAAAAPVLDRRPVAQYPHAPAFDLVEQRANRLAGFGETLVQLGRIAVTVPALFVAVGMEYGDQIEQFAGAQRIVHQMHLLAGPQHHVAPAVLLRHFRGRQHGAIGDVACGFRWTVADHDLPDGRPQAVGADQSGAAIRLAALGAYGDAVSRLFDRHDLLRGIELDQIGFAAGFEQYLVQIGAMDQRVRMMEFPAKRIAERNARDLLPGHRIHHDQVVGKDRERADRLDQAERLEHPEHIGPELDAGADFLELRRLLDDLRGDPLARQRQRRRQPADAAADNDDLLRFPIGHFTRLLPIYCTFTYRPRR